MKFPAHLSYFESANVPSRANVGKAKVIRPAVSRPKPARSGLQIAVELDAAAEPDRYTHLLRGVRGSASSPPSGRASRHDRALDFAAEMERVVSMRDRREPQTLVEGPRQVTRRVSGDDILAAARAAGRILEAE